MTIIITDEDVRRLLPMRECIDAMRVAFRDFAAGDAVNRPRMRYLAKHPDPDRRYMANVHVGAVPSSGIACVRAGSQIMRPATAGARAAYLREPASLQLGICHPVQHRNRRTAGAAARIPALGHAGRRDHGRRGRRDRAAGRAHTRAVRHRQAGAQRARSHCAGQADRSRQCVQPERRTSHCLCAQLVARRCSPSPRWRIHAPSSATPTSCAAPPAQ